MKPNMNLAEAIFVAIFAGVSSALLSGQLTPGAAPLLLFSLLSPLPIFVAGFGWHPLVGALAGIAGTLMLIFGAGGIPALIFGVMTALPGIVAVFAADRLFSVFSGRPERDGIDLGRIAIVLVMLLAFTAVLGLMLIEPDLDALMKRLRAMVDLLWQGLSGQNPTLPQPDMPALAAFLAMMSRILIPSSVIVAFLTLVIAGTLGMQIAERMGRLAYPRPDFRRFRLPGGTLILLGAALIVASRAGYLGLFGEIVVGMLLIAYLLQGLGVVHARTIGMPMRLPLLGVIWITLILMGFPGMIFILLGMADHLFNFRRGRL